MPLDIESFKNAVKQGVVRTNLFLVQATLPPVITDLVDAGVNVPNEVEFLVQSASIPASNVQNIELPFRGRKLRISGDRQFDTWELQVLCAENMNLRKIFERWTNAFSTHRTNIDTTVVANDYMSYMDSDWTISVLSRNGNVIPTAVYTMRYCWPVNVGAMDLSFDSSNQATSFPVSLRYLYWTNATNTDQ